MCTDADEYSLKCSLCVKSTGIHFCVFRFSLKTIQRFSIKHVQHAPCTEAASSLQGPRIRFHPVALSCTSCPHSLPHFLFNSSAVLLNKFTKRPKILVVTCLLPNILPIVCVHQSVVPLCVCVCVCVWRPACCLLLWCRGDPSVSSCHSLHLCCCCCCLDEVLSLPHTSSHRTLCL